jgi:hypothetical protein
MTLGLFEGVIGVLWGISIYLLKRHFSHKIAEVESQLKREIVHEARALQDSIENSIDDLQHAMGTVADMDPLEAISVQVAGMKAQLMQNILEMGVGWIGQKFQKNLGVFESMNPEPQGDTQAPLLDESSPN